MKSINIENIKSFTTHLFARETFDGFLVTEASFSTVTDISIDGHINREFLSEEELALPENSEDAVFWKRLRFLCFEIIKGQRVPLRFKIVFKAPAASIGRFLESNDLSFQEKQVNALFLNVNYQEGRLICTTGTSLKEFTLDKSLEQAWDEKTAKFLIRLQES
ncbi:MAG: hypothetical protein IKF90_15265 [Parasporobacterium sp.]|nr:hypothetical protein [Parasporobacterium sp.]